VLLHYYPSGVLVTEAASATCRSDGEHEKGKKWLHIQKLSVWCLQNLKPRHGLSGALRPRNPDTLCLVPSKSGGPRARQLVLVALKVMSSPRTTGVRDVAGSKLDVCGTQLNPTSPSKGGHGERVV